MQVRGTAPTANTSHKKKQNQMCQHIPEYQSQGRVHQKQRDQPTKVEIILSALKVTKFWQNVVLNGPNPQSDSCEKAAVFGTPGKYGLSLVRQQWYLGIF